MAKGVNKVILLGNLGRAAEIRATAGGTTVASFSLATPNRIKGHDGNWADATDWHNCVAYGRLAEIIRDYTGKGSRIYVEGKLQTRSWDDKETGRKVYRTEVILADITLIDKRPESRDENEVPGYAYTRTVEPSTEIEDSDIPF